MATVNSIRRSLSVSPNTEVHAYQHCRFGSSHKNLRGMLCSQALTKPSGPPKAATSPARKKIAHWRKREVFTVERQAINTHDTSVVVTLLEINKFIGTLRW